MKDKHYPKVLIVGQTFNYSSGSGITKINLFRNWSKERIAVATFENIEVAFCANYYQIGYEELKRPWPFHYVQQKNESGRIHISNLWERIEDCPVSFYNRADNSASYPRLKKAYHTLLHLLGLYNYVFTSRVTSRFIEWVNEFNPDIIYDQLSTLSSIRFLSELHKITGVPYAIHIMDDWMMTINKPGVLNSYWGNKIDSEFRALIDNASVLMSICQEMSDEYSSRYNKKFIPFHNPVDLSLWGKKAKNNWNVNRPFKILYAGRIGRGTSSSILDIAQAVEYLSKQNMEIIFEIQTTSSRNDILPEIRQMKNTLMVPPIDYKKLPERLSNVDLLVLPMDFDSENLRYIAYSMPTKTAEYMATGTPILVYASHQTALSKYALREGWGHTVIVNDRRALSEALTLLYSDISLRERLGRRAKEIAALNHDADIVREDFRKALLCQN